jgi:hypothetical protein
MGHTTEKFFPLSEWREKRKVPCGECKRPAQQIITRPAIMTIQSFHKDIQDPFVRKHASKDGYYDPNLGRDRKTGKRTKITSPAHREKLMREAGLEPFGETDVTRDADSLKRRKPFHVGAGGPNRRAHG